MAADISVECIILFSNNFSHLQFKSSTISQPLFIVALFSFASNYLDKIVAREGSKNINLETTKVKVAGQ